MAARPRRGPAALHGAGCQAQIPGAGQIPPVSTFNVFDEGNREALAIEIGTSIPSALLFVSWTTLSRCLAARPACARG